MIILHPEATQNRKITTAIFDFDGTISTLRANWEVIMRELMLTEIWPNAPYPPELEVVIDRYIHDSTGIQTAYQMAWLHERVQLAGQNPAAADRDLWWYKDAYNDALIRMVNERIAKAQTSAETAAQYRIPGSLEYCQKLHKLGVQIYVASGTDHDDVVNEATILGLAPYTVAIKGAPSRAFDDAKKHVLNELLKDLDPAELLIVGDGKVEIALGYEAGALTIGAATDEVNGDRIEPAKYERLVAAGADVIVPNFLDIEELLGLVGLEF